MSAERYTVPLAAGRLALVLHLPGGGEPCPCVVACHGLSASKDSDKYLLLGDEFPRGGVALARFDFRGCGESSGVEDETTIATRLEDARAVIETLCAHPRLDGRFGLLGSSMGGFVALHLAHERGDGVPVVTWNAPASLADLTQAESTDGRGIGVPLLLELAEHRYEVAPSGIRRHLIIHAAADEVVPLEHGTVLHSRAAESCDFVVIPDADHRLTLMEHRRQAIALSRAWFARHLVPASRSGHPQSVPDARNPI